MKKRKQPTPPRKPLESRTAWFDPKPVAEQVKPARSVEEQVLVVVAERRLTLTVGWTGTVWQVDVCGSEDGSWGVRTFKAASFTGVMNACYNWMFVNGWVGG